MASATTWNELVNSVNSSTQRRLDIFTERKNTLLGQLLLLAGDNVTNDVLIARQKVQSDIDSVNDRLSQINANFIDVSPRLYQNLSSASQQAIEYMIANLTPNTVRDISERTVNYAGLHSRAQAGMASVTNASLVQANSNYRNQVYLFALSRELADPTPAIVESQSVESEETILEEDDEEEDLGEPLFSS